MQAVLAQRGVRVATPSALAACPRPSAARASWWCRTHSPRTTTQPLCSTFSSCCSGSASGPGWRLQPNGKPQHVLGLLEEFGRTARRNADMLSELADTGVSLVGVDPSMTLAYRAEYVKALGKDAVPVSRLAAGMAGPAARRLPSAMAAAGAPTGRLLPHCTERTNAPAATSDWVKVGRRLGVDLQIVCERMLRHGRPVRARAREPGHRKRSTVSAGRNGCPTRAIPGALLPPAIRAVARRRRWTGRNCLTRFKSCLRASRLPHRRSHDCGPHRGGSLVCHGPGGTPRGILIRCSD